MFYAYLSEAKDIAKESKYSDAVGEDAFLGELLGYPGCCIKFFDNYKRIACEKQMDLAVFHLDGEVREYSFYNNYVLRYFDISLINHFPCSLDCKHSQNIAKKNLSFLKKNFPKVAESFEKELKSFVIYTENRGIFYSPNYRIDGNNIYFDSLNATAKNELYYILKNARNIEIYSHNRLINSHIFLSCTFKGGQRVHSFSKEIGL
ncbi:MAG: DUF483 domain-containing protein [Theionarchaea archaeon]|nr:DUF483 domain-containing protein [Theionarchaea archaeon]